MQAPIHLQGRSRARQSWPRLTLTDGGVETLKWIALTLMVVDHVDKFLFHQSVAAMFAAGRVSMPLFAMVLGYNLARPDLLLQGQGWRIAGRMVLVGLLASVPYMALGGLPWGWWPLNILMMLALTVAIAQLTGIPSAGVGRWFLALLLFFIGGAFVEFWWPGMLVGLATWRYARRPGAWPMIVLSGALASLTWINGNAWALMAVPIVLVAMRIRWPMPRMRWFFYAFYPLHLAVLWCLVNVLQSEL